MIKVIIIVEFALLLVLALAKLASFLAYYLRHVDIANMSNVRFVVLAHIVAFTLVGFAIGISQILCYLFPEFA